MPVHFAIDFGTTNTVVASDAGGSVTPVAVKSVMAERTGTPVVPSAVYFPEDGGAALIGQGAVDQNLVGLGRRPNFAQGFKRHLRRESRRFVARLDERDISAERASEAFFDGLRAALRAQLRPRRKGLFGLWDDFRERRSPLVSHLALTAPIDSDEAYRRRLTRLGHLLGARNIRVVDEPVAAALGYGVNVGRELVVLVLDWGGGTLDLSIVRTGSRTLAEGRAEVLAKSEAPLGGEDVDRWIVERFLIPVERFVHAWELDAQWAACQAKEAASIHGRGAFQFRDRPAQPFLREDLEALLAERGAYAAMERALEDVLDQVASRHGMDAGAVDEVLLVGGSSLLPGVDPRVRAMLPQARVGEWNPFAAVATGACEYARGGHIADQVYHDYALRIADDDGGSVYYELVVPAGTRYPTPREFTERVYVPDPGSPNEVLVEIGEISRLGRAPVGWQADSSGCQTWRPADAADHKRATVVNDRETMLRLPPSRRNPRRLRVTYRVDEDRYLRWTIRDGETVLKDDAVLGRLR